MRRATFIMTTLVSLCLSVRSFAGWTEPVFIDSGDELFELGIEARNDSVCITYNFVPPKFLRSLDDGLTWQDEFLLPERSLAVDALKLQGDTLVMFHGGDGIQFHFSTNFGATWEGPRNCGSYPDLDRAWADFNSSLVTVCNAHYLHEETTVSLKHSTDFGITWAEPESIWMYPHPVDPFFAYFFDRPYILSSDLDPWANSFIKLLFTADDGESWISYDSLCGPGTNWEQRMDASPGGQMAIVYMDWDSDLEEDSRIFVCLSPDSGLTWTPPTNLSVADVNRYPRVAVSGDTVVVAWQGHVDSTDEFSSVLLQRTYDFGQTWQPVEVLSEPGSPGGHPSIELVNGKIHLLCAGWYGGIPGIYYMRWEPESGVEEEIVTPLRISLHSYPNPFNATTTISYSLPERGEVSISIYNLIGQRVATVFERAQEAGEHTVTWDARDFPSGVYFARLETGESTETIKMVLLK